MTQHPVCHCKHVHQGVVISIDIESQIVKVFMKILNYSPLKDEKLQFIGGVVGLSLCQTPTGRGDDGICSIITSLVEDSP